MGPCALAEEGTEIYKVNLKYVYDGDTVTVVDKKTRQTMKIRMLYIDAPEFSQEGGKASKNYLVLLIKNYTTASPPAKLSVRVYGMDNYGPFLGVLRVDRTDVNKLMVKAGQAA